MEPITEEDLTQAPGPASSIIEVESGDFPWWLVAIAAVIVALGLAIAFSDQYREAFEFIIPGVRLTAILTGVGFVLATGLGLLLGLGRISGNAFIRNASTFYVEFVRGIPVLVFLFLIVQVAVIEFADLVDIRTRSIPNVWRVIVALSLFYAAFIAEVFRAGIQSVPSGQVEAGRAIGLTRRQNLRLIVLPQAIRNMLPALGNDFISLLKDTSLVSVFAVRELTQLSRLYTGSTFRFREGFLILTVLYVSLTLLLSLLLRWYEKKIAIPGRGPAA